MREIGTGEQVAQLLDCYMMKIIMNSVRTSNETKRFAISEFKWLTQFKEIIYV
jgi:hypothetical protein